ncbi:MAG: hypothetical protein EPN23_00505 [Verrucomicrobia bacterium]|nr:MAG: hypothetical protein EPN23_00505 [Verrucomicrobiota bacterium]
MNTQSEDKRLTEQLRQWRGIEPRAGFEAEVWQRVAAIRVPNGEWFEMLRQWFGLQPAWASAAAALIAVAVGISSTNALAQPPRSQLAMNTPTLNGQTLASTYLAMATGVSR